MAKHIEILSLTNSVEYINKIKISFTEKSYAIDIPF